MNFLAILAASSAALNFAKETVPIIRDALNNGDVSVDQQDKVRAEYESLRNQLGGEFTGEHWELSGR